MSTICIIENETGYDCAHVSIGTKGAFIRTWPKGAMEWDQESVSPGQAASYIASVDGSLTVGQACKLVGQRTALPVTKKQWGAIFQDLRIKLNRGGLSEVDNLLREKGKLIPITRLRKIYSPILRHVLTAKAFHELLCSNPEKMAEVLADWFCEACRRFARYDNSTEPFYTKQEGEKRTKKTLAYLEPPIDYTQFAMLLKAKLIKVKEDDTVWQVTGVPNLNFRFVDFEISPYRTTNRAVFSDGRSGRASGGGGLDLLLSTKDGVPVIGEIKAKTDVDMFFALVQSLVYASELGTPNQVARLKNIYLPFGGLPETTKCDIYLIFEDTDADPGLLKETLKIAKSLLLNKRCRQYIRRIAFISAKLSEEGGVEFHCNAGHIFT